MSSGKCLSLSLSSIFRSYSFILRKPQSGKQPSIAPFLPPLGLEMPGAGERLFLSSSREPPKPDSRWSTLGPSPIWEPGLWSGAFSSQSCEPQAFSWAVRMGEGWPPREEAWGSFPRGFWASKRNTGHKLTNLLIFQPLSLSVLCFLFAMRFSNFIPDCIFNFDCFLLSRILLLGPRRFISLPVHATAPLF